MQRFNDAYIVSTGAFMPGEPVDNEGMDKFIQPIDDTSSRMKKRILRENGIVSRHYALDEDGNSKFSVAQMAANAVRTALQWKDISLNDVSFLSTASTGADSAAPGLANYVQAELKAQPLETVSVQGICASSLGAMKAAAQSLQGDSIKTAVCVASEFPSRLFKKSRFLRATDQIKFDAHFLRWMLSDGAASIVLQKKPAPKGLSLKLHWMHSKSFSGQLPTCMNVGGDLENTKHYLDYPSLREAEEAGAFFLRQDIRLLPNLFDLAVGEFAEMVREGHVKLNEVDHFLCHYSSERFSGMIKDVLAKAQLEIPAEKWFSNLKTKGNTGSASILIMLDEFFRKTPLKAGQKILGFVPESGRFTIGFFLLEVVDSSDQPTQSPPSTVAKNADRVSQEKQLAIADEVDPGYSSDRPETARLLQDLMGVWHQYRSRVYSSNLAQKIFDQTITQADYLRWMESWIPQVREGSLWMRKAVESLPSEFSALKALITLHADEEMNDFKVLYDDYKKDGGTLALEDLVRNPAGEALNSFMYRMASTPESYLLLGATFIIEGTGQRIIPSLLPRLKNALRVKGIDPNMGYRFLEYHGQNDVHHMQRWLDAIDITLALDPKAHQKIVQLSKTVSDLYALQWEWVDVL